MKCPNCHNKIDDDAKFCPKCGIELSNVCPKCGTKNDHDSLFCKNCGAKLHEQKEEKVESAKQEQPKAEKKPICSRTTLERIFSIIAMSGLVFSLLFMISMIFVPIQIDDFFPLQQYTIIGYFAEIIRVEGSKLATVNRIALLIAVTFNLFLISSFVITGIVMLAISIPQLIKNIREKTYKDFSKKVSLMYAFFIFTIATFNNFILKQFDLVNTSINGVLVFSIILVGILLAFNLFYKEFVSNNNNLSKIIKKTITRVGIIILLFVIIFNLGEATTRISFIGKTSADSYSSVTGNFSFIHFFLFRIDKVFSEAAGIVTTSVVFSAVSLFSELFVIILGGEIIQIMCVSDLEKKNEKIKLIAFGATIVLLAVLSLVFSNLASSNITKINAVETYNAIVNTTKTHGSQITNIVLSGITLSFPIFLMATSNNKEKEE